MSARRLPLAASLVAVLTATLVSPLLPSSPAVAAATTFSAAGPVDIRDSVTFHHESTAIHVASGAADRYPAQLNLSGLLGRIVDVQVSIDGLAHQRPEDLDILLVGPTGASVVLLSDAGGSAALDGVDLAFTDSSGSLQEGQQLTSTGYRPSNFGSEVDAFPAPAPSTASSSTFSGAFHGTDPNGTWSLFVVDDSPGATGILPTGWTLTLVTAPSSEPFPSMIDVEGVTGQITDVDVTLTGLEHPVASELDIVLKSPTGMRIVLMSDVGGTGPVTATLHLDDSAASTIPADTTIQSGAYRPTDGYNIVDTEPELFPPFTTVTGFDALRGTSPNGTWQLYVQDDTFFNQNAGRLAGWSLHITTTPDDPPVTPPLPPPPPASSPGTSDTTPPTGTVTIVPRYGTSELTSSRRIDIRVTASEPLAGIRVSNDGGPLGAFIAVPGGSNGFAWSLGDADGVRRIFVQLQDRAGNVSTVLPTDTVVLERVAPRVKRSWPTAGARGVSRAFVIRARFDDFVHPSPGTGLAYLARVYRVGSTTPVRGTVRFDASTATVKIIPKRLLRADTRYKVVVTSFLDEAGNYLDQDAAKAGAQPMLWKFRTR